MFKLRKALVAATLLVLGGAAVAQNDVKYPGVGRAATPKEVAAWDIDVRPDFKGLPAGSGTVAKGQDIWEAKCAQCHGIFGESGEVFSPLVGGVTPDDIKKGRVANLMDASYPGRTTFMKVPTLSTVWDYINRAMPWIVPDNFTLSDKNMTEVQGRMPNRNGMTTKHAMWPGNEFGGTSKPDTSNVACMKDCVSEVKLASFLPEFARNAHGNLAEQNRAVGAQHGADTTRPEAKVGTPAPVAVPAAPKAEASSGAKAALALLQKNACTACHGVNNKIVGPAFTDIAKKHAGKADYLAGKIKSGGSGVWGAVPMPPQTLSDAEAKTIAAWLAAGAGK
jgi:cytochrome c551/c552